MFVSVATLNARSHGKRETLHGYLVDVACSRERAKELAVLGQVHTKQCLLMPDCQKSGYALLTPKHEVLKFDAAGNEQAKELITSTSRPKDYRVVVSGRRDGDELNVMRLELETP